MSFICQISNIVMSHTNVSKQRHIVIIFLMLSFLFADLKGISQTKEIDSLKAVELVTSDTATKTKILLTIANKYRLINYDSVLFYTNKAYDYALLTQNNIMVIKCLIDLAYINVSIGNNDKSIPLYNQAKQLCTKEDNQYLLAYIYIDLGRYYSALSNYAEVINSLDTALDIINNNNITQLKSVVYNNISHLYLAIHDIDIASYYSNLAITYSKGDTNKTNYINNLFLHGKIFLYKNMLDSTFLCYNNALTIAKESNNKELIQQAYRKISDYYIEKKEYNNSNQYIDSSIIYCRKLNLINELASLLTYKAHISSIKKDYTKALQYNLQALELRKKTGHRSSICSSLLNIGGNYTPLGEYDKAHSYLERGIEIANEINSIIYLNYGYDKLSKLYKSEGNFEEALQYTDLKTQYKDLIITNQSNEKILFFRIQYELENENENKNKNVIEKEGEFEGEEKNDEMVKDMLLEYFGFNRLHNNDKLKTLNYFLNYLKNNKKYDNFLAQFDAYKEYKKRTKDIVHGFRGFIGSVDKGYEDGGWNQENWIRKVKIHRTNAQNKNEYSIDQDITNNPDRLKL